jgi:hypothetical protein
MSVDKNGNDPCEDKEGIGMGEASWKQRPWTKWQRCMLNNREIIRSRDTRSASLNMDA